MANYETHQGVTLRRVRVRQDVFFVGGKLKAQAGAVGLLAGSHEGRGTVTFEYHENDAYVAPDGGGRPIQLIELIALKDA